MQSLSLLQLDFRKSWQTDRRMNYGVHLLWLLLTNSILWFPAYTVILIFFPQILRIPQGTTFILVLYLFGFLFMGIWWHVLSFYLVDRHQKHFNRKAHLFEDLVLFAREMVEEKDINQEDHPEIHKKIYSLEIFVSEYYRHFPRHNPVMWTILSIISLGFSTFFMAYFLMVELRKLQELEDEFLKIYSSVMEEFAILKYPIRNHHPVPQREFGIFAALSVLTLGLFWFYWWYTLIVDTNRFFDASERWEASLNYMLFFR